MGEQAKMHLNGMLCELCGVLMDGKAPGYPRRCDCCKDEDAIETAAEQATVRTVYYSKKLKRQCGICKAWIKEVGMKDHVRDKHEVKEQQT
jgi:hypothetical protein